MKSENPATPKVGGGDVGKVLSFPPQTQRCVPTLRTSITSQKSLVIDKVRSAGRLRRRWTQEMLSTWSSGKASGRLPVNHQHISRFTNHRRLGGKVYHLSMPVLFEENNHPLESAIFSSTKYVHSLYIENMHEFVWDQMEWVTKYTQSKSIIISTFACRNVCGDRWTLRVSFPFQ